MKSDFHIKGEHLASRKRFKEIRKWLIVLSNLTQRGAR